MGRPEGKIILFLLVPFFVCSIFQISGGSGPPAPGVEIPSGAFVAKITNDAREDEMEENMQQVQTLKLVTQEVNKTF